MRCGALADLPVVPTAQSGWGAVLRPVRRGARRGARHATDSREGELKQITILFADVAGSTSAIEELIRKTPTGASRRRSRR